MGKPPQPHPRTGKAKGLGLKNRQYIKTATKAKLRKMAQRITNSFKRNSGRSKRRLKLKKG